MHAIALLFIAMMAMRIGGARRRFLPLRERRGLRAARLVNTDSIDQGFVLGNKVLVAEVFAKNGFLMLASATGEENTTEVCTDQIYQGKGDDAFSATIPWKHLDLQRV